ncbi:RAB6-interacting golgin isoform X2 [Zerene cesonia]|uniref:RAB6-interacting golgin isoform X2 n=1 Tax=Zerene cesonia TaxID=33412 RepID=UPI0018E54C26|nr:RAB6-interacting golgin isoform X2 [Zerene cesonia]
MFLLLNFKDQIIIEAVRKIEKIGSIPKKTPKKPLSLQKQVSDDVINTDLFEKCKLSLTTPSSPPPPQEIIDFNDIEMTTDHNETVYEEINENRQDNTNVAPDVIRCVDNYTEDDLVAHKVKLEELQLRQKLMEEQNKKRKEMLAKALADRTKQTEEEVQKLEKIKKELQVLDGQFSQDVAVLRKKIDQACISYSEAEKNYLKIEKEFLQAKIHLQKEKEKKELLTEHLCALITHNETRKAQKLETLMLELANDKNKELNEMSGVVTPTDDRPIIIHGVDEKTGKMVEVFNEK